MPEAPAIPYPLYPWSEIIPRLWMGGHAYERGDGTLAPAIIGDEFDLVFSLHRVRKPQYQPPMQVAHYFLNLDDEESMAAGRLQQARDMARRVAAAHTAGNRILVRCAAGYNRSGLIVGLALRELGWDGPDAVNLIRHQRSLHALHNRYFVDLITGDEQPTTPNEGK